MNASNRSNDSSFFFVSFSNRSFTSSFHLAITSLHFKTPLHSYLHFFCNALLPTMSLFSQCFIFFKQATIPVCCK